MKKRKGCSFYRKKQINEFIRDKLRQDVKKSVPIWMWIALSGDEEGHALRTNCISKPGAVHH